MGEIVRVLKWRLDVDAEGMASGIDKAATSAERLQKATAEVGEKGAAGLKKVSTAADEADESFKGLGLEAQAVERYIASLEKGAGTPLTLERNAKMAAAAFELMKQNAREAGVEIPAAYEGRVSDAIRKATTYAAALNAEIDRTGGLPKTKLDKVTEALKGVVGASASAATALAKMGDAGAAAALAVLRLEASEDSPRELARNAALAQVELDHLRESLDKAAATGKKFGPDVAAAMERAEKKIADAAKKSRELADASGDMKTRGDMAAKGFEAVAGSAGSAEGILSALKDTTGAMGTSLSDISIKGKNAGETLANLGFAAVALGGAFDLGYSAGKKINTFLQEHGDVVAKVVDGITQFVTGTEDEARALEQLDGPVNKALRSHQAFAAAAKKAADEMKLSMPVSLKAVTEEFNKFALVLSYAEKEGKFTQFAVKGKAAAEALRTEYRLLGEHVPAELEKVIKAADEYTKAQDRMAEAKKRQETMGQLELERLTREWESRQKMVEQAKAIIQSSAEQARATGNWAAATEKGDKALEALAAQYGISKKQLDEYIKSSDDFAKKMKEVADANATATSSELAKAQALAFGETALKKQAIEAEKAFQEKQRRWAIEDARGTGGNFSAPVVQGYEAIRQAAIGAAAANGQFGTDLDMVAKQVVALGGELKVGVPIYMQVTEQTDEMTQAFLRAAVAARQLREEQAESLSVTKGWTDYVMGLKQGYDDGIISLTTYISLLGAFRTQITQMFAGATGDAAEAVKALQDLVTGLMSNIGPRDTGSGNRQLDDLNRAINDAKNRKK